MRSRWWSATSHDGSPVVIRNHPLLDDGRPMPTRYWLLGEPERTMVSRLESRGGVHRVEDEIGLDVIAEAHDRYRAERDAALPDGLGRAPARRAGVGGTRVGVKCLHAHYGWCLAGGDDPVGRWVAEHLRGGRRRPSRRIDLMRWRRRRDRVARRSTSAPTPPACSWPRPAPTACRCAPSSG